MRLTLPVLKAASFATLVAGTLLLSDCSRDRQETVLARVGDAEITLPDFTRELQARQKSSPTPVDPKALLEELVTREVLVQSALKAGLQDDPEVRELVRDVWIAKFKERKLNPLVQEAAVSKAELKAAYDLDKDKLTKPERVRLAMLFVSSPAEADPEAQQETRRRLEAAAKMGNEGGDGAARGFGAVAVNVSEDQESRYRGGEIGWVERERFPPRLDPAVVEAGFALKSPGDVSEIITGRDGFYVVKLLERMPATITPLEQAEPALRRRLLDKKQEDIQALFQSNLRKGLAVETHPERLASLPLPATEATPPAPSIP